ncbi:MAG TPA: single-stranded-DNA-specific exonuclease RecJ, partial [Gemmatimonadales bacterium]|nr:single-stranded-DNA-specific exonuclease RecJ [Gemmatimonadales bacterium]
MPLQSTRWQIARPVGPQQLARFPDLQPLVVQLLHNRGIEDPAAAQEFLSGRATGHNPFDLKGMGEAVARLREAVRRGERIAIYGDFDTDGVTATALLVQALSALGARVEPYIPHRVDEGYGLHLDALRELHGRGVRVVVTVDCGIRSVHEVTRASRKMDLIVTDHHSVGPALPPAVAILNPKQKDCPYPFKDLAGVGLAYKLAQALLRVHKHVTRQAPKLAEEELLDLVALGTVSDLAPLLGENRVLVRQGLEALNEPIRPGVEALMADAGLRRGGVDASAIGFRLGPRLNAAGRIDSAMVAYRLLTSTEPLETKALAERLGRLNQQRQEMTEKTVAEAEAQVRAADPEARLFLVSSPDFNAGIVGLAASRLMQAHYRPSVVVELGERYSRGSCRSIPEFNITDALDACQDLLVRHGGHAAAAGFTVETDKLDVLGQRLQAIADEKLAEVELRPTLAIDVELPLEEVSWATLELLRRVEPCGEENPRPVLASRDLEVREARAVGDEQKHLKLTLRDGRGVAWDAMYFRHGHLASQVPARVDVAYRLDANEWNHRKRLQLLVED